MRIQKVAPLVASCRRLRGGRSSKGGGKDGEGAVLSDLIACFGRLPPPPLVCPSVAYRGGGGGGLAGISRPHLERTE